MYGRLLKDLVYNDDAATIGNNNFLQQQLGGSTVVTGTIANASKTVTLNSGFVPTLLVVGAHASAPGVLDNNSTITTVNAPAPTFDVNKNSIAAGNSLPIKISINPRFARIYAFSFEGAVYNLPRPTIFLVHGKGTDVDGTNRTDMETSGVAARDWEFSGKGGLVDLAYWEYEKGDFSLRLDSEAGPLEQILLQAALRAGTDMVDRSGASLGVRSGASLSGASVSGASLSGASLTGAGSRTNR
jgi:hypothetical protein